MRQEHRAGEKLFVDYCGQTIPIVDALTGEIRDAQVFVAVNRPFKKLPGTRTSRFEELDRPAMLPLPETNYQYSQFKKVRVHIDYHIELEGHFYSVPHRLVREQMDARYTVTTVECLYKGNRVADAILDRLVHNAYKLELKGESMRSKRTTLDQKAKPVTV